MRSLVSMLCGYGHIAYEQVKRERFVEFNDPLYWGKVATKSEQEVKSGFAD